MIKIFLFLSTFAEAGDPGEDKVQASAKGSKEEGGERAKPL